MAIASSRFAFLSRGDTPFTADLQQELVEGIFHGESPTVVMERGSPFAPAGNDPDGARPSQSRIEFPLPKSLARSPLQIPIRGGKERWMGRCLWPSPLRRAKEPDGGENAEDG